MAADRGILIAWLADLGSAIVTDGEDASDLSRRLAAAPGLSAEGFASEMIDLMRVIAESVDAPVDFDRIAPPAVDAGDTLDAACVLVALGLCIAGGKVDWPSRPMARAARTRISDAGDAGLAVASAMGGDGAELYGWLANVVSASVRLVSDLAANAVPVIRVETGISLPSTVLAYKLYGDASRAGSLVDIAGSATPMIMPSVFEALAS